LTGAVLVVSGLAEDQQLMSTGIGETVGSFGRELGIHGGTMLERPGVFLLPV